MKTLIQTLIATTLLCGIASGFEKDIRPFLNEHCLACHGGEKVKGKVDFSNLHSSKDALAQADLWDKVAEVLEFNEMPPEDEPQPSAAERDAFLAWHGKHFSAPSEALPGTFQPRRLSASEYRNTLRSLFGFDLEVIIAEAEQTVVEKSLVQKLLPPDPPGASGFVNDTHGAPLSTTLWDQYSYLADTAINELFSDTRKKQLNALTNSPNSQSKHLTPNEAEQLLRNFLPRAFRRPLTKDRLANHLDAIAGLKGQPLVDATKAELKAALMSPTFLYRGLLMDGEINTQQPVDQFELAERLSYFLWEDMPDAELARLAAAGKLDDPAVLEAQVDRLLASPRAHSLAESFATQWLTLDEINTVSTDPTRQHAFRSQAIDFTYYLFTENRPVIELIDSDTTFANDITAAFYPKDRSQLKKYSKPKGIERVAHPNQKLSLKHTTERGGILTMPGVLAMNHGPILRGTWMLRNILGVELGEPPGDVPPIKPSPRGQKLTFRERFEDHRADAACARCHNKIDPIGFAMQAYNNDGGYLVPTKEQLKKKKNGEEISFDDIDTSGRLPTGETFDTFAELKEIFLTGKRRDIIRNAVERTLAYALCRELERFDGPTIDTITDKIIKTDGTWRDLFLEVALSLPFQETVIASEKDS